MSEKGKVRTTSEETRKGYTSAMSRLFCKFDRECFGDEI